MRLHAGFLLYKLEIFPEKNTLHIITPLSLRQDDVHMKNMGDVGIFRTAKANGFAGDALAF